MISEELQAILDLGFEHYFDADLNIHSFIKDGDTVVSMYPPKDKRGWMLVSDYYTFCSNKYELTIFFNFMKTLSEDKGVVKMNEHPENTVNIPVKQYAESIMAIQKLEDIRRIVHSPRATRSDSALSVIDAIKAITAITESGEGDTNERNNDVS